MNLFKLLVEIAGDTSPLRREMDRAATDAKARGKTIGERASEGFRQALVDRLAGSSIVSDAVGGSLRGAVGAGLIRTAMATGVAMSNAATEVDRYRRALTTIGGDAATAEKALRSLQDIAAKSNFNTDEVLRLGTSLAGKSGDVAGTPAQVAKILDAATAFQVTNADFGQFQKNLSDLTNKGDRRVDKPDMDQFRDRAPAASAIIAKALGISAAEASKKLQTVTGDEFKKILETVGEANKGAAASAAGSSPQAVIANTGDALQQAGAETGAVINRSILPLTKGALAFATTLGVLNKATGGQAGLVVTFGAIAVGGRLLFTTFNRLQTAATLASVALDRLAAKAAIGAAAGGAVPGGVMGPASAATKSGRLAENALNIVSAVAIAETVRAVINGGAEALGKNNFFGRALENIGSPELAYAGPLGVVIATNKALYDTIFRQTKKEAAKTGEDAKKDANTKALEANTKALEATRFSAIGGGGIAGGAMSQLEREYAAYSYMRAGRMGIG